MAVEVLSVVGGERVADAVRRTPSTNPGQLSDVVGTVGSAGPEVFVRAAEAARAAQSAWAATPAPQRGQVIANVGRLMTANKERLAALVTREIGKPIAEARGEVQEIIDTCDFFIGEGRRLYGQTVPSEMPDKQLFTFRRPVGTVAVITAGNFPVAVPSWYIVPALLCGNTVVWKPAEYSAVVSNAFYEIFAHSGVPAGVFNLVYADGPDTFTGLEQALQAGLISKVGFTGSSAVGTRIGELCGRHLQNPCLELGGKNPMVITEDADLDLAVEGALFSGFGTAGQRCTSLGTVIVHESVHDEFVARFSQAVAEAAMGDPTQDVLFGPLLDEKFAAGFEKTLGWITDHHHVLGATGRVTGDNPRSGFVGDPAAGLFYHPVIVTGVRADDELFLNETFGPVVGVTSYSTLDEAIALGNKPGYGLSSSIYTTDPNKAFRFAQGISAGMVSVNNSTSGAEAHLPFGGNGKSGNGSRQSGVWVLDQFTRWQSLNWDYSGKLQKAQMDTATVEADFSFQLPLMAAALPEAADVVIVGGGVMGTSIAFHLAEAGVDRILLLEKNDLGSGSTSKAAGGVRANFSDELNIALGARSLEAFARFGERPGQEIDLHRVGYLFLLETSDQLELFRESTRLQNAAGQPTQMIDVDEAVRLAPIVAPDGLAGACFSPADGHCTPESVVLGYATAARRLGATVITSCKVLGIDAVGNQISTVRTSQGDVRTTTVICAAGAWAAEVGQWIGIDLPVTPLRRQIVVTEAIPGLPPRLPMTIDFSSTFYFHREGPGLLVGMSDPEEQPGFHLNRTDTWLPRLTEAMSRRAPSLLDVGLTGGWAGLYEVTPDHNALIGEADGIGRFLYATGFSGHGFLQGPAVGEIIRDLYLGREPFIDISPLGARRFHTSTARAERNIV